MFSRFSLNFLKRHGLRDWWFVFQPDWIHRLIYRAQILKWKLRMSVRRLKDGFPF